MNSLRKRNRRGYTAPLIIIGILAAGGLGGVLYWIFASGSGSAEIRPIMATAYKGQFVSQVLDQGEVQSSENVEIRCDVESRNGGNVTVIDVVPEGTLVNEGDFLVLLDSTVFEKELEQQRIAVTAAETSRIQAKAAHAAAQQALKEFELGTFVEQERTIQNDIFDAEQRLEQNMALLAHSRRLHSKGFLTSQQLKAEEIAVASAQNSLDLATQKLNVLREITKEKELITLNSDIEAAKVKWDNEEKAYELENQKLIDIETQIKNCTITVPPSVSGEVVYNTESDRRSGSEWVLEPGAQVRERQVLIRLPNRKKMEVKARINEQSIISIRPGMPVSITVDALNNQKFKGVVTKVNQYAEATDWRSSSSIREYAAFIRIIDPPAELIPGMNASVTIQTLYQQDAVQAPLQCVYAAGDQQFVLRETPTGLQTVEVVVGGNNSQAAWIKSGVEPGDRLVMNPGAHKSLMDLPELEIEANIDLPDGAEQFVNETQREGGERFAGGGPPGENGAPGEGRRRGGGGERGGGRGGPGGGGFGSPDQMVQRTLDQYDSDGDGKLSSAELEGLDERTRGFVTRADSDGNGEITRDEMIGSMRRMMEQFQQGGGGRGGFDRGGN